MENKVSLEIYRRSKGMETMHDFKVKINMPVRWGDINAFQHVNNTVYVKWIENVRVEYSKSKVIAK